VQALQQEHRGRHRRCLLQDLRLAEVPLMKRFCIDAHDEAECQRLVEKFWKPKSWRFCEEKPLDFLPGNRFPMSKEIP
jgi:hypothetical protein